MPLNSNVCSWLSMIDMTSRLSSVEGSINVVIGSFPPLTPLCIAEVEICLSPSGSSSVPVRADISIIAIDCMFLILLGLANDRDWIELLLLNADFPSSTTGMSVLVTTALSSVIVQVVLEILFGMTTDVREAYLFPLMSVATTAVSLCME